MEQMRGKSRVICVAEGSWHGNAGQSMRESETPRQRIGVFPVSWEPLEFDDALPGEAFIRGGLQGKPKCRCIDKWHPTQYGTQVPCFRSQIFADMECHALVYSRLQFFEVLCSIMQEAEYISR